MSSVEEFRHGHSLPGSGAFMALYPANDYEPVEVVLEAPSLPAIIILIVCIMAIGTAQFIWLLIKFVLNEEDLCSED